MEYREIEELNDLILKNLDVDLSDKFEKGCINNILRYVKRESPNDIKEENRKIVVSDNLINDESL